MEYPTAWPAEVKAEMGTCPDLSGTYLNAGALAATCGPGLRGLSGLAAWNCDASLAGNLIKMTPVEFGELKRARGAGSITLLQPDQDTLELRFPSTSALAERTYRRSQGHFECAESGATYSMRGSTFVHEDTPGAFGQTATAVIFLGSGTGLMDTTVRAFRRLQDGSIVMDVRESSVGVSLLVPLGWKSPQLRSLDTARPVA